MRTLVGAIAAGALLVLAGTAEATVLFSRTFTPNTGDRSDADTSIFEFNQFSLGANATVDTVTWQGFYYPSGTPLSVDAFTIDFFNDVGGAVGSSIGSFNVGNAVNRTDTGQIFFGPVDYFQYTAGLSGGVALTSGTPYWISIFNDTSVDSSESWYWATDSTLSPHPYYFILAGDSGVPVPEPDTISILVLGLATLLIVRHLIRDSRARLN